MNCNIYAWGNLEAGYSQFPTNYTQNIIKSIFSIFDNTIRDLCVTIRNEDLIYLVYGYQYKNDKSFGFCLEFNRVCPCNVNYIYSFFRAVINDILAKGKLLHYATSGEIQSDVSQLYEQSAVIEDYVDFILHNFNEEQANFQRIPPINRGTDYNSTAYALDESIATITNALRQHATLIFLPKKEDESINSYANVLKQLNKKNVELYEENNILRRQKNKIVWVLILLSIIFIGAIVFFFVMQSKNGTISDLLEDKAKLENHVICLQKDSACLSNNLKNTTTQLIEKQKQIRFLRTDSINKSKYIDSCQTVIYSLKSEISRTIETERKKYEKVITDYNNNIKDLTSNPLIIYDIEIANTYKSGTVETDYGQTIYSTRTMYLKPKIKYIGLTSGSKNLRLRLYNPDGTISKGTYNNKPSPSDCTYADDFNISTGKNECALVGWGNEKQGHWGKGIYKIEIWHSNTCLYSKQFTIY